MKADDPKIESVKPRRWITKPRRTYRLHMSGPQNRRDDPDMERFVTKIRPKRSQDDILEDHAKLVAEMEATEDGEHEPVRPKKIDDQDRPTRDRLVGLI